MIDEYFGHCFGRLPYRSLQFRHETLAQEQFQPVGTVNYPMAEAFTRALAAQLADKGIRVNAVAPGPIWTPLNPFGGASPEKLKDFGKSTPLGRPGQPNEMAPSFLFLACEDASYMTGQVLHPNGGVPVGG